CLPPSYIRKIISKIDYILSNNEIVNKQIAEEKKKIDTIKETNRKRKLPSLLEYKYLYENRFDDLVKKEREYFISLITDLGNESQKIIMIIINLILLKNSRQL